MNNFLRGFKGAISDLKMILGFPITWGLYWVGHAISKFYLRFDALSFLYPVYNKLMCMSGDVQDWAGLKSPWSQELKTNKEFE